MLKERVHKILNPDSGVRKNYIIGLLKREDPDMEWSYVPNRGSAFLNLYRAKGNHFVAIATASDALYDFFRSDTNYRIGEIHLVCKHSLEEFERIFGKEEAGSIFAETGFCEFTDTNERIYKNCLFGGEKMIGKAIKVDHNSFDEESFLSELRKVIEIDKHIPEYR